MQRKLNEINNQAYEVSGGLNTIDGQMIFFGDLIEDMHAHPEEMGKRVQEGDVQKQLYAIYTLLHNELLDIKKCQEEISKISSENLEEVAMNIEYRGE
ncbi:hypothetical protein CIL05_12755 [Virgibacillus profundi]|uniref:Uncharacterized protein n=1 Tax=Virgibacillus profundi TaxID=2024555 RepID=A0A2A2IDQ1_9BACI|nr:hypothetical protein [Virgibacillus profundi]PAV29260.1 hypothetical protein CIL05_12755 [Virgibacillus profundi]PXY53429.1 hypothetical protein CIT14_12880 [Virgibacillus profundi]